MSSCLLYRSIQDKRWHDAIQILNQSPHQAQYLNYPEQRTSLHTACSKIDTPIQIVQKLLSANAQAALLQDSCGYTPLNIAIMHSTDEIVLALIKACPRAVSIEYNHGQRIRNRSVLHEALLRDRSLSVLHTLLKIDPSKIWSCDNFGNAPIHYFFEKWNVRLREIKSRLGDSLSSSKIESLDIIDILGRKRKLREIYEKTRLLLKVASTGSILEEEDGTWKEVHACLHIRSFPWSFTHLLLKIHPEQTYQQDKEGNLPIHIASSSTKLSSDGELYKCAECKMTLETTPWYFSKYLWSICEDCFSRSPFCGAGGAGCDSNDNATSLHQDYTHDNKLGVVEKFHFNEKDFTLIHPVQKNPNVINDLLALNPRASQIPNKGGRLSLFLAIESGKPFHIIKLIYYSAPKAISTKDMKTHLFPFMMAAVSEKRGREVALGQFGCVFGLLMEDPNLIMYGIPRE